ncbi:MAG: hypothetical protein ABJF86_18350 [Tateyamaria sp.]|uniref:hypothetical protein n=1 Tax=Tateyamaria sp. TaxID=1929288 RepID=UPI003288472C
MVNESEKNLRETLFINVQDIADGSLLKIVGSDAVSNFWDDWSDPADWITPPLFTPEDVKSCRALIEAFKNFNELGLENTTVAENLMNYPEYRAVESKAKVVFKTMSVRGARPLGLRSL